MDIFINGQPSNGTLPRADTVGHLLGALRDQDADLLVVDMRYNGQPVGGGQLDTLRARSLAEAGRLELEVDSARSLARRTLGQVAELLQQSCAHYRLVAELLAAGCTAKAMELLTACFTVWNAAEQSLQKACRLVGLDLHRAADGQVRPAELIDQLRDALQRLKQHLQDRDFVAVGDLVEYDIAGLTGRWQDMLAALRDDLQRPGPRA